MSDLILYQRRFAAHIARLILAAVARGIPVRFADAWRDPRIYKIIDWAFANGYDDGLPKPKCHPRSLHFDRLAVDLIAPDDTCYAELHDIWDGLEGSERIPDDMNHFSFPRGDMT